MHLQFTTRRMFVLFALASTVQSFALAGDPQISGRRSEADGLPVIEVWGAPRDAGFAQGYLTAPTLVELFDNYVLSPRFSRSPEAYEQMLRPMVARTFAWSDAARAELEGIVAGARERLGAPAHSRKLDRDLTIEDLEVVNTLADWRGVMCSSISLWGELTTDSQTLTARNLDYPALGGIEKAQFILVRQGNENSKGWVAVSWPGLIGAYTAMNQDGVTVSIHDAHGLPPTNLGGGAAVSRPLVLREALEAASAASFLDDFRKYLGDRPLICGGNIHVSGPRKDATAIPAVVFEWDGNKRDHGFAFRTSADNTVIVARDAKEDGVVPAAAADPATGSTCYVTCTNHMRLRCEPTKCDRYAKLCTGIGDAGQSHRKLDAAGAMKLIQSVADKTTQHSVVFQPATRKMLVLIPGVKNAPVEIDVAKLLESMPTAATK